MLKAEAFTAASNIADKDNIVMVVTHNPYDEFEPSDNSYGYFPQTSYHTVEKHEALIATVYPNP